MITAFEDFDQIASALQVAGYVTGWDERPGREAARLFERQGGEEEPRANRPGS